MTFRHSITHLFIFSGLFFKWQIINIGPHNDIVLKRFLLGYIAYVSGSIVSGISGVAML